MTAADLIQFLRQHPKTCGVLGVRLASADRDEEDNDAWCIDGLSLDADYGDDATRVFRVWLSGASTAKADEMGLETASFADGFAVIERQVFTPTMFGGGSGMKISKRYPTRLAATFAAIEAALDKVTTT